MRMEMKINKNLTQKRRRQLLWELTQDVDESFGFTEIPKLSGIFMAPETGMEGDGGTLPAPVFVEGDGGTFPSPMFIGGDGVTLLAPVFSCGTVKTEEESPTQEDTEEEEHLSLSVASLLPRKSKGS